MIVYFSPQRPNNDKYLGYEFEGDKVIAKFYDTFDLEKENDEGEKEKIDPIEQDTFDFSELEDGDEVAENEDTGELDIETEMSELPILSAKRNNDGELEITVRHYHEEYAPESERYPEPIKAGDE